MRRAVALATLIMGLCLVSSPVVAVPVGSTPRVSTVATHGSESGRVSTVVVSGTAAESKPKLRLGVEFPTQESLSPGEAVIHMPAEEQNSPANTEAKPAPPQKQSAWKAKVASGRSDSALSPTGDYQPLHPPGAPHAEEGTQEAKETTSTAQTTTTATPSSNIAPQTPAAEKPKPVVVSVNSVNPFSINPTPADSTAPTAADVLPKHEAPSSPSTAQPQPDQQSSGTTVQQSPPGEQPNGVRVVSSSVQTPADERPTVTVPDNPTSPLSPTDQDATPGNTVHSSSAATSSVNVGMGGGGGEVTVILMSYDNPQRRGSVRKAVEHYASLGQVMDMVVLWNSKDVPVPDLPNNNKIRVFVQDKNSLNNRWTFNDFKPSAGPVLIVDDDKMVLSSTIDCFVNLHKQKPQRLIGNDLRAVEGGKYTYDPPVGSFVEPPWMVHKDMFQYYGSEEYSDLRRYVDEQEAHCDDTLMNRVMYDKSKETPLSVAIHKGGIEHLKSDNGISHQENRDELRAECVQHIQGGMSSVPRIQFHSQTC